MDGKAIVAAQLISLNLSPEISTCDAQFDQKHRVSGCTNIPSLTEKGTSSKPFIPDQIAIGIHILRSIAMFYAYSTASARRPCVLQESAPEARK